jgi:23S rRNA pseudouridine2605 synthase
VSKLGLGSRTVAWDWIRAGEVRVDGRVVTDPLTWIDLDRQTVACAEPAAKVEPLTFALHKPKAVVTTRSDERGRRTVYDLMPADLPWVFPAGRLDADSEGLLILTNDSALSTRLTEPGHGISKTYHVVVAGRPSAGALDQLRKGVELVDGVTRPAGITVLREAAKTTLLEIVLTEGRNRQIRRMTAAMGNKVKRLVRVAIGAYPLGDLAPGACRRLGAEDVRHLLATSTNDGRSPPG